MTVHKADKRDGNETTGINLPYNIKIRATTALEALTNVLHKNILRTLEGKRTNYYIRKLF